MRILRRFRAWRRLDRMRSRCKLCGKVHSGDVFHPANLACWHAYAARCEDARRAFENASREPKRLIALVGPSTYEGGE